MLRGPSEETLTKAKRPPVGGLFKHFTLNRSV